MLSDHSLYCNCYASSKDNISIATTEKGVFGDFIVPMEMVLNRLKAEYSLARKMFFEYKIGSDFLMRILKRVILNCIMARYYMKTLRG